MPHAMVVGIVQAITTTLGDWLAKGYTVEIEGLGFFSTTLKCTHPVMNKKEVRAESVKMSTVKFRPGIEFKRYVAGKMELWIPAANTHNPIITGGRLTYVIAKMNKEAPMPFRIPFTP